MKDVYPMKLKAVHKHFFEVIVSGIVDLLPTMQTLNPSTNSPTVMGEEETLDDDEPDASFAENDEELDTTMMTEEKSGGNSPSDELVIVKRSGLPEKMGKVIDYLSKFKEVKNKHHEAQAVTILAHLAKNDIIFAKN
eukprot:gene18413-13241_t